DLLSVPNLSALSRTCRSLHIIFTLPLFGRVRESLSTHLCRVVLSNNVRLLTYLLDEGLPVDCTVTAYQCSQAVATLLHFAAASGSDALVRLLIDRGANITAAIISAGNPEAHVQRAITNPSAMLLACEGGTPLHCAAINGHDVVAMLLIEDGAVVCAAAADGMTPRRWTANEGHCGCV
ncbi:ankyrin repeat-containing domain protein, partial [Sphaerosporella brunnea]